MLFLGRTLNSFFPVRDVRVVFRKVIMYVRRLCRLCLFSLCWFLYTGWSGMWRRRGQGSSSVSLFGLGNGDWQNFCSQNSIHTVSDSVSWRVPVCSCCGCGVMD